MTILFNNGPLAGKFATIPKEQNEVRVRYLKDGQSCTAVYAIGERMRAATRNVFASAAYIGDMDSADSLIDLDWGRDGQGSA